MGSAPRSLSVCQTAKTITQIRQMSEPKTRARLKGSNFCGIYRVFQIIVRVGWVVVNSPPELDILLWEFFYLVKGT